MLNAVFVRLVSLCCLLLVSACTRVAPPSDVERPGMGPSSKSETTHIVKEGETTLVIAKMYNMREDELIRINNIVPPYKISKGQRLKVRPNSKNKQSQVFERVQEEKEVEVTALNVAPQDASNVGDLKTVGSASSAVVGASSALADQAGHQPFSPPEGSPPVEQQIVATPNGWQAPLTKGTVLYRFGDKLPNGTTCDGVTWKAPLGTPVVAASKGTVIKAGQEVPAYGNMVVVKHPDGKLSVYAHLKQIDKGISVNKQVAKGQMIGQVGKTGQVNDPQLHFQVRGSDAKKTAIDPLTLMS